MAISGPAADALKALSSDQIAFIQNLPKAELHAHLNGSIPISVLQQLAREHLVSSSSQTISNDAIQAGINTLLSGPNLNELHDFFDLFPAIYALMATPPALARAVRAVLSLFLDGEYPQCTYLELRTTPKATPEMSREDYLRVVLNEMKSYGTDRVGLIVSMDRKMDSEAMRECVELAKKLKAEGEPVVGVDLCGNPTAGDPATFRTYFKEAKEAGLGVTLHIAEVGMNWGGVCGTAYNTSQDTLELLSFSPDRLGHATFLDAEAKKIVAEKNACIEICLSSNLLSVFGISVTPHLDTHYNL
ncbi:hypothetical protein C0995_013179 [Termitomyces sp. Mi166|nr:hypothetical protein C0995_013179 [Termitomyces sp. Mi166\